MAIDWEKIKMEYITTNASQRDLAEKYNVSITHLNKLAKKDNWVRLREEHKNKSVTKALQKMVTKQSNEAVDELMQLKRIGSNLDKAFEKITDESSLLEVDEQGRYIVEPKTFQNLYNALRVAVEVHRDLYDLPNVVDKARIDADADKDVIVHFAGSEDNDYGV